MERLANEAAEAARKEQVILSCARRDAARAAADMQQRHLEAACQLEGGAARAAFESARAEETSRLLSAAGAAPLLQRSATASPSAAAAAAMDASGNAATSPAGSSVGLGPFQSAIQQIDHDGLLQERCRRMASEVESKLGRWKDSIHAPLAAEPSLSMDGEAGPSKGGNIKLLHTKDGGQNWPTMFAF